MFHKTTLLVTVLTALILTSPTHALTWDGSYHLFDSGFEDELFMINAATADFTGGEVVFLLMYDNCQADVYDDATLALIKPFESATVDIHGGTVTSIFALDSSVMNIFRCSLRDITADNSSIINLYVENDYDYDPNGGIYGHGLLTGTWFNTTDDFSISLSTYAYDHINFVPEPCSLFTVLLGGIFLSRRKK